MTHVPRKEGTRDHDYGLLAGGIAVNADYNPVKELDMVTRQLASVHGVPTEEAALDFIVTMSDAQRRAAVAIMEGVDRGTARFVQRIRDFEQFFTESNAEVMRAFGNSPYNGEGFAVEFGVYRGRAHLTFKQAGDKCDLQYTPSAALRDFVWP